MIGEVTRRILPHLSGVTHLYVNRPYENYQLAPGQNTEGPQAHHVT